MNMNNNDDIQKMFWANDNDKTGILLGDKNIKLHRKYFEQISNVRGLEVEKAKERLLFNDLFLSGVIENNTVFGVLSFTYLIPSS